MLVSGLFMMLRGFLIMVGCLFCHGLPLLNGSLQYAEKPVGCLVKIAQRGKNKVVLGSGWWLMGDIEGLAITIEA